MEYNLKKIITDAQQCVEIIQKAKLEFPKAALLRSATSGNRLAQALFMKFKTTYFIKELIWQ